MSIPLGPVRVAQPVYYGRLTVFPLLRTQARPLEYQLSDEAMEAGSVTVAEVSEQGSVPDLVVENRADRRVLFLEGEELRGAKQNRILNTTVLVPGQSKIKIPVSCVEAGRWQRTGACFSSGKTVSPSHLRHTLKSSVSRSLKEKMGHRSDQGQVWDEVRKQQEALEVSSCTSALSDTYEKFQGQLGAARQALPYVEGSAGLAVALGSRVVSVDFFDQPATCRKVWDRLLSGLMLDALSQATAAEGPPDEAQVTQLLDEVRGAAWSPTETVGEGQELRAEFAGKVGSALLLDGALVHGSVLASMS
jgi:hypothetical protein